MKYIEIRVYIKDIDQIVESNIAEMAEDIKDTIYTEYDVKDVFWEIKEEVK